MFGNPSLSIDSARATIWAQAVSHGRHLQRIPQRTAADEKRSQRPELQPQALPVRQRGSRGAARGTAAAPIMTPEGRSRRRRPSPSSPRSTATSSTSTGPTTSTRRCSRASRRSTASRSSSRTSTRWSAMVGQDRTPATPTTSSSRRRSGCSSCVAAGQLRPIDPSTLNERRRSSSTTTLLRRPLVRPAVRALVPFSMYKTGIGWRKDKLGETSPARWSDLWNADGEGPHVRPRRPRRGARHGCAALGYDTEHRSDRTTSTQIVDSCSSSLRPYLRGFDSDDYDNLLAGDAWMHQTWSGDMAALLWQATDPSIYGFEAPKRGHAGQLRLLRDPGQRAAPRHRAAVHRLHAPARRTSRRTSTTSATRCRCRAPRPTYEEIVADYPQCVVTVDDLPENLYFRNGSVAKTQARDAAWTDMKVGV